MKFVVILSILCSVALIDVYAYNFQFYPEKNFQGKAINVSTDLSCHNLDEYTQGKVMSINAESGIPYFLHNAPNCSESGDTANRVILYGPISDLDEISFGNKAASFELESW